MRRPLKGVAAAIVIDFRTLGARYVPAGWPPKPVIYGPGSSGRTRSCRAPAQGAAPSKPSAHWLKGDPNARTRRACLRCVRTHGIHPPSRAAPLLKMRCGDEGRGSHVRKSATAGDSTRARKPQLMVGTDMYRNWKNWLELNVQTLPDTVLFLLSMILLVLLIRWVL